MPNFESLNYETNQYQAVVVDSASLPSDGDVFADLLPRAIEAWQAADMRSIWIEFPLAKAGLIGSAADLGFKFMSTTAEAVTMTYRLDPDVDLPHGPTHQIAAAGLVVNDQNELLVIVERTHALTRPNFFKLPGGLVDPGEKISAAAEREVFEETGIRAKFEKLTTFRHWIDYRPNKSDIYFICRLSPLTFEITPRASEIDRALWMPLDEYLNHPDVSVFNKMIVELGLKDGGLQSGWFEGYDVDQSTRELYFSS